MRIWSVHPKYLDAKGLVALWRETLLAKHVLEGKTKGYKNHPQLDRFKEADSPGDCINFYLSHVLKEASRRGYNFSKDKIKWDFKACSMTVTRGQLNYETTHLLNKLRVRDEEKYQELGNEKKVETHPLFHIVEGEIEDWEVINT